MAKPGHLVAVVVSGDSPSKVGASEPPTTTTSPATSPGETATGSSLSSAPATDAAPGPPHATPAAGDEDPLASLKRRLHGFSQNLESVVLNTSSIVPRLNAASSSQQLRPKSPGLSTHSSSSFYSVTGSASSPTASGLRSTSWSGNLGSSLSAQMAPTAPPPSPINPPAATQPAPSAPQPAAPASPERPAPTAPAPTVEDVSLAPAMGATTPLPPPEATSMAHSAPVTPMLGPLNVPREAERTHSESQGEAPAVHEVKAGDTLAGIALHHGLSKGELMRTNRLFSEHVYRGQILFVPRGRRKESSAEAAAIEASLAARQARASDGGGTPRLRPRTPTGSSVSERVLRPVGETPSLLSLRGIEGGLPGTESPAEEAPPESHDITFINSACPSPPRHRHRQRRHHSMRHRRRTSRERAALADIFGPGAVLESSSGSGGESPSGSDASYNSAPETDPNAPGRPFRRHPSFLSQLDKAALAAAGGLHHAASNPAAPATRGGGRGDVWKGASVIFCPAEDAQVKGVLTVSPTLVIFEPYEHDSVVRERGLVSSQVCMDAASIVRVRLVQGPPAAEDWAALRRRMPPAGMEAGEPEAPAEGPEYDGSSTSGGDPSITRSSGDPSINKRAPEAAAAGHLADVAEEGGAGSGGEEVEMERGGRGRERLLSTGAGVSGLSSNAAADADHFIATHGEVSFAPRPAHTPQLHPAPAPAAPAPPPRHPAHAAALRLAAPLAAPGRPRPAPRGRGAPWDAPHAPAGGHALPGRAKMSPTFYAFFAGVQQTMLEAYTALWAVVDDACRRRSLRAARRQRADSGPAEKKPEREREKARRSLDLPAKEAPPPPRETGGAGSAAARALLSAPHVPLLSDKSSAINPDIAAQIGQRLPKRYQGADWHLLYSTEKHGISLKTFYARTDDMGPTVLVVRDRTGGVFGAFCAESWQISPKYFGGGEAFLWVLRRPAPDAPAPAKPRVEVFGWSHKNEYFQLGKEDSLAIGAGGHFGLWVDAEFENGTSGACDTFDSPPLASTTEFQIVTFEAWGFRDRPIHNASLRAALRAQQTSLGFGGGRRR
eukprot:tig00000142_g8659.t1